MNNIPYGYCQCGCGEKTKVSRYSNTFHGHIKGQPRKFLSGHNAKINPPHKYKGPAYLEEDRGFDTSCWIWRGPKDVYGYGWTSTQNKKHKAHTHVYRTKYGDPPAGLIAHHKCEQKLCVNPDHLEWVTRAEHANIHRPKDPSQRGYAAYPRPQYRKVSPASVEEIRSAYSKGGVTQADLARRFGVSQAHIWRIVNHKIH